MRLYLSIALVSLEGSLSKIFLCMNMLMRIYDMYMMNLHIVDAICDCCHLGICVGLHC